jgi:nucleoside-diphosphate-sugar epimerase
MIVSVIGTNGLIANEVGLYCNNNLMQLISYGRREPYVHSFQEFNKLDLLSENIDISRISKSDVIIYACGAGVQSNIKVSSESIYKLNTYTAIDICNELSKIGYKGTFVTFGSCFEIGDNSEPKEFTEIEIANSILAVPNDYCVSKRLLTKYVMSKRQTFKHLHLVLPTIYGEREADNRLIPYTVSSIKRDLPMEFTSGKQIRQYIYVGDAVRIVFELIALEKEGVCNLSGIETYSVRAIIEEIYQFYGLKTNEELFGKAERADVGMQNLQLDGSLIKLLLPDFEYSRFKEILKLYDECF